MHRQQLQVGRGDSQGVGRKGWSEQCSRAICKCTVCAGNAYAHPPTALLHALTQLDIVTIRVTCVALQVGPASDVERWGECPAPSASPAGWH